MNDFVELLKTYNPGDIALLKSILDSESIKYKVRGENFNMIDPLVQPAIFFVEYPKLEEARALLKGLDISYFGLPNT